MTNFGGQQENLSVTAAPAEKTKEQRLLEWFNTLAKQIGLEIGAELSVAKITSKLAETHLILDLGLTLARQQGEGRDESINKQRIKDCIYDLALFIWDKHSAIEESLRAQGGYEQDDTFKKRLPIVVDTLKMLLSMSVLLISQQLDEDSFSQLALINLAPRDIIPSVAELVCKVEATADSSTTVRLKLTPIVLAGLRGIAASAEDEQQGPEKREIAKRLLTSYATNKSPPPLSAMIIHIAKAEGLIKGGLEFKDYRKIELDADCSVTLGNILAMNPIPSYYAKDAQPLMANILNEFARHQLLTHFYHVALPLLEYPSDFVAAKLRLRPSASAFFLATRLLFDTRRECVTQSTMPDVNDMASTLVTALTYIHKNPGLLPPFIPLAASAQEKGLHPATDYLKSISDHSLEKLCQQYPVYVANDHDATGASKRAWTVIFKEVLSRFNDKPRSRILKDAVVSGFKLISIQYLYDKSSWHRISQDPFSYALTDHLKKTFGKRGDAIADLWCDEDKWTTPDLSSPKHMIAALRNLAFLENLNPGACRELNRHFGIAMLGRFRLKTLIHQYEICNRYLNNSSNQSPLSETSNKPLFVLLGGDSNSAIRDVPKWGSYRKNVVFFEGFSPIECLHALMVYNKLYGPITVGGVHMHGGPGELNPDSSGVGIERDTFGTESMQKLLSRLIADKASLLIDACCSAKRGGFNDSLAQSLGGKGVEITGGTDYSAINWLRRKTGSKGGGLLANYGRKATRKIIS